MGEWGHSGNGKKWHAVLTFTRVPGRAISMCRRNLRGPYFPELRPEAARCKTCRKALGKIN